MFFSGWFWFLGTMIPVIGLVQVGSQSIADRYTYVPLIGVFIILTWGLSEVVAKWWSVPPWPSGRQLCGGARISRVCFGHKTNCVIGKTAKRYSVTRWR